jgi:hypothetical protein
MARGPGSSAVPPSRARSRALLHHELLRTSTSTGTGITAAGLAREPPPEPLRVPGS